MLLPIPPESESQPLSQHDIVIAVMGATGGGKSSFINLASGRKGGTPGHELQSCTQEVQAVRCPHPCSNVVFLDTPGFDDTGRTDFQILENIATWLNQTYRQGINLTGILFLQRISDNRMTGTSRRNTNMFSLLCGRDALQNVILVTTMWSEVDEAKGASRENELRETYWKPMIDGGCKMMRFNYTSESAWHIIAQLNGIRRPLQLQIEMIDKRKTLSQTAAASAILRWLTELMDSIQTLIKQLRSNLRTTSSSEKAKEIEDELAAQQGKLKAVKKQKKMAQRYNNAIHIPISRTSTLSSMTSSRNSITSSSTTWPLRGPGLIQEFSSPETLLVQDQGAEIMAMIPFFKDVLELSVSIVESIEAMKKNKGPTDTLAEDIDRFCKVVGGKAIGNTSDIGRALDYLHTELMKLDNSLKRIPSKGLANTFIFQPGNKDALDDYNGNFMMAYEAFVMRYTILMSQELQESRPRHEDSVAGTACSTEEDTVIGPEIPDLKTPMNSAKANREKDAFIAAPHPDSPLTSAAYSSDGDMAAETVVPDLTGEVFIIDPQPISAGGFSYVFKGDYHGAMVAIKALVPVSRDLKTMNRKMKREREVWGTLIHPNITPFYGYTRDERAPLGTLISPWYQNGDAIEYLTRNGHSLDIRKRKEMLQGVVNGVSYLHTREPAIVHGDLKPGNILIDDEGNPRLCDFGLARIILQKGNSGLNTTSEHLGTPRYLAPELIPDYKEEEEEYKYPTTTSDIFAIGCTGLQIVFQQLPYEHFEHERSIIRAIKRGEPPAARPTDTTPYADALWAILESCWNFEPESRPNTAALLASLEMHGSK